MIAGLEQPDAGSILIDGDPVFGESVDVAPRLRNVGLVFQDGALFPHMSVLDNVAYGLGKRPDLTKARKALALVDLEGYEHRLPGSLSGGQQQRVAVARALAPTPRILLLDEPLASLDADLRVRIRADMAALLHRLDITAVFVTHDQEEAFVVGDQVAVMRNGRILQKGTPTAVYESPVDEWVAQFVGDANLVPAVAEGSHARATFGMIPLSQERVGSCLVVVRPEHLALSLGSDAQVQGVEFYGHDTAYQLALNGSTLTARILAAPRFGVGSSVDVQYVGPPAAAFAAGT